MTKNKRVIVLGSGGFIGSHLVAWLQSQGYYVIGVDKVEKVPADLNLKREERFYKLVLPDQHFEEILMEFKPEAIINASGSASVAYSFSDPAIDFNSSVSICFFILETIRKILPDCRFLLLSSAAVYGNPRTLPIPENTFLAPISPYGYHKMICEALMKEYSAIYNIKTSIVRIFSAYGPGLRKQILWDLYQKAKAQKSIYLYGTGEETRDFIFIYDIVKAIQIVLERSYFNGDVYNLANGFEVSIKDLSRLFVDALGMQDKPIYFSGETKLGDPKKWCADITLLKEMGYSSETSLEKGLQIYAKWVLNHG